MGTVMLRGTGTIEEGGADEGTCENCIGGRGGGSGTPFVPPMTRGVPPTTIGVCCGVCSFFSTIVGPKRVLLAKASG